MRHGVSLLAKGTRAAWPQFGLAQPARMFTVGR
jgi:hypothetical protein